VIAGCGGSGGGSGYPKAAPNRGASAAPTVALTPSKLGSILVDGRGRALYLFEADKTTASTCYSSCASVWPPLTVSGAVTAGPRVIASQLGQPRGSNAEALRDDDPGNRRAAGRQPPYVSMTPCTG
jgi:hypothetical protein